MNTATETAAPPSTHGVARPRFDQKNGPAAVVLFAGLLAAGLLWHGLQPVHRYWMPRMRPRYPGRAYALPAWPC